jgi:asparagine synthase (glutamine-hydrolysing)
MCGIAVAVDWDGAEASVRCLIAGMLHRGDVTDPLVTHGRRIAMCTRRLRVVDAALGVQPQASFDERFLVSLNGEIYNHRELRHELEALGIRFRTECDTEVVANVLRVWGANGIKRLAGMYAFVAIDTAAGEFLAARDPFGVKPLYLIQAKETNGFLFCSEIRPLLDATEDQNVLFLPPGYMLTRDFCGPFYKLPVPGPSRAASPQELDRIVAEAVRIRMPPDLPLAMFFSGGLDSTLVLHYARRFKPEMPSYIAVGNNAPDHTYARRYADETDLDLREVAIDARTDQMLDVLKTVVAVVESFEPAVIRPSVHTYLLSERIHRDGFRVALCGEGADELFAGYEPLEIAFMQTKSVGRYAQKQCLAMMHRANLQRIDRCSMRFQLEIREPFLDQTIVNHAIALDESELVKTASDIAIGKAPLRALYDLYPSELPDLIRNRQKLLFHEGAGAGAGVEKSDWRDLFEGEMSDADFYDGQLEFADFQIATKEELFYMRALAAELDVKRVPHLRGRLRLDLSCAA